MAWTDLTFSFGSLLTAAKMTQLVDNYTAMATGLSGAPTITGSALSTSLVVEKIRHNVTAIAQEYRETGVSLPGGLWRTMVNSDTWSLRRNTAGGGDFSTETTVFEVAADNSVNLSITTMPKGWIKLNGTGTPAADDSHNVSSVVDNGTGDYTINWDTDFANTNYAVVVSCIQSYPSAGSYDVWCDAYATGSVNINVATIITLNRTDSIDICAIAMGEQ